MCRVCASGEPLVLAVTGIGLGATAPVEGRINPTSARAVMDFALALRGLGCTPDVDQPATGLTHFPAGWLFVGSIGKR